MFEVEAHFEPTPWMHGDRLWLFRRRADVVEFFTPAGRWFTADPAAVAPEVDELGQLIAFTLPRGGWEAICRLAAPMADVGAVGVLRDWLEAERERVDRLVDRVVEIVADGGAR